MPQRQLAPDIPDINALPEHALLTQQQLHKLTGFALITFRIWASQGRGPKVTRINGNLPRYMARDVRAWIEGNHAEA
jgi:predicted DNA-binding transcriptional regulator AlpA